MNRGALLKGALPKSIAASVKKEYSDYLSTTHTLLMSSE
jgi:hypothetical protein